MIDLDEINNEITKLEVGDTTWNTCEKLSVLYTVRDRFEDQYNDKRKPARNVPLYSMASSEFVEVASQIPVEELLDILNSHMDSIKLLYPKEYDTILRKIRSKM